MNDGPSHFIVATGLTGLVGSELAHGSVLGDRLRPLGNGNRVDVTDEAAVHRALDANAEAGALLHLAAFTDTNRAHEQRGDREGACFRVNVLGSRILARACADRGLHLIQVSTDYVFRGDRREPYNESDQPDPIDWYGETKWLGEQEVMQSSNWTIVRLAFPYGSHRHQRDLLAKILGAFERSEPLRLFDDQFITPTFLGDIAEGLVHLLEIRPQNQIVHLTGSECTTPYDFGLAVAEAFGLSSSRIERSHMKDVIAATGRPRHRSLCMDNARWLGLASAAGQEAPLGIREGLKRSRERMESAGARAKKD